MQPPQFVVLVYLRTSGAEGWLCMYIGDDRAQVDWVAGVQRAMGHEVVISAVTPEETIN